MADKNETAFPLHPSASSEAAHRNGLTKREMISAMVLQGMNASLSHTSNWPEDYTLDCMVKNAVMQADALLEALNEGGES